MNRQEISHRNTSYKPDSDDSDLQQDIYLDEAEYDYEEEDEKKEDLEDYTDYEEEENDPEYYYYYYYDYLDSGIDISHEKNELEPLPTPMWQTSPNSTQSIIQS